MGVLVRESGRDARATACASPSRPPAARAARRDDLHLLRMPGTPELQVETEAVIVRTILATMVAMALGVVVSAECVAPPPPCDALARSSIVFVGDVIVAGPFERQVAPDRFEFVPQPVRFRVVERFKGVREEQKEVDASIKFDIEGIQFVSGLRFVVYASVASDGTWGTACSRTGTVKQRPEDVRELRLCKSH